jgi:hypothetical protein
MGDHLLLPPWQLGPVGTWMKVEMNEYMMMDEKRR